MKIVFFVLSLSIILLSCKPKANQPETNSAAKPAIQKLDVAKKLKPIYQGVWVKDDYIQKIKQTHSVLAAVDLVSGITGLQIDTARLTGDSLLVPVGWDNHNPGTVTLKFKPGKNPQAVKFGEDELGYSILNGDTTLIRYQLYKGVLYKTPYRRAMKVDHDENVSYAINLAINKALIAGNYSLTDARGQAHQVTFTAGGSVTGLAKFSKYVIENDLEFKPLNNLDLITFDVFTNKQTAFSYVFKNNKLELYAVKPNAKGTLMMPGKLEYKLIRQ